MGAEERLLAVRRSWTGLHEIGLFALLYVVYFGVRAFTEGQRDVAVANAVDLFDVLPPSFVNEYAAMPSFHAGWNLLLGIALWRASRHLAVRAFALLMPAAMAFAVMATGNHFLLDVVAGAAIILVAVVAVDRFGPRRVRLHS